MKKWILKAIVQKTISFLPFSHKINYFFQKNVTKGVFLTDEYFFDRLGHGEEHLKAYAKHHQGLPTTALELGTGWYPVVPIVFFLCGVEKIYSLDISFLTSKERIQTTLLKFAEAKEKGKLSAWKDAFLPEKWEVLVNLIQSYETVSLEKMLEMMHITYLIEDARKLSLSDDSVDLINSNNTYEHIYPSILHPIMGEFQRVMKRTTGIQSHFIDMSDHFAHFDKSINIYHFLRFTEKQWAIIDNDIQPQSRLRMQDYLDMYRSWNIPIVDTSWRPGDLTQVKNTPLATPYKEMTLEQVAISHCHIVSKA